MAIADATASRAARSCSSNSRDRTARCSTRCRSASSCASSASPRRPTASHSRRGPEVRRHGDAPRPGARARARRARRPAARRPRRGQRRRRHVGRRARRFAREHEGALDSGLHASASARSGSRKTSRSSRVETPRSALKGTSLVVDVVLSQTGYSGQTVPLNVEDEGRLVSSQDVELPRDGESATVPRALHGDRSRRAALPIPGPAAAGRAGHAEQRRAKRSSKSTTGASGALLRRRAALRDAVHAARDQGRQESRRHHPAADRREQVPPASRRQSPDEVIGGFPKTREELFAYRAIILGSVEAAAFTPEQMRMLSDFVSKRGGGLLMLGGRRSFVEGGGPARRSPKRCRSSSTGRGTAGEPTVSWLNVRPTRDGAMYPVTQIAGRCGVDDQVGRLAAGHDRQSLICGEAWRDCAFVGRRQAAGAGRARVPALRTRQGARDADSGFLPVVFQREAPVTDKTHATFWRRLVRWLVDGVPTR